MTPQEFDERLDAALENYANFKAWESKQDWREGYDRDANIANSRGIAKQAIRELFEEDAEQKQAKIMALVCAENGGEFSISRKTYEEYDDNCVLERLDSPLMDSVVYRLRTTITGKEGGE